jgi:hypothetical protein
MRNLILVFALILAAPLAQAATEYLRFEGSSDPNFYFDFVIDISLEAPGYTDETWQDFFAAEYLGGSDGGAGITHGLTAFFPEGWSTYLYLPDSRIIGAPWDWLDSPYPDDESIGTWDIGDSLRLMEGGVFSENAIAGLRLTYRDASSPPAIVPIPATAWLFGSALGLLGWMRRKKAS